MSSLNSFDLFEKNPHIHSQFPFLILDVNNNNNNCVPPRLKFHEMHWHDDLQLTFVINGEIQIKTIFQTIELKENEIVFINKKILIPFVIIDLPKTVIHNFINAGQSSCL